MIMSLSSNYSAKASGMYVGCLTYISILTSVEERPMYMGLIGLVWYVALRSSSHDSKIIRRGVGTILGPVVSIANMKCHCQI